MSAWLRDPLQPKKSRASRRRGPDPCWATGRFEGLPAIVRRAGPATAEPVAKFFAAWCDDGIAGEKGRSGVR